MTATTAGFTRRAMLRNRFTSITGAGASNRGDDVPAAVPVDGSVAPVPLIDRIVTDTRTMSTAADVENRFTIDIQLSRRHLSADLVPSPPLDRFDLCQLPPGLRLAACAALNVARVGPADGCKSVMLRERASRTILFIQPRRRDV